MKNFLNYIKEGIDDPYNEENDEFTDEVDKFENVWNKPTQEQKAYLNRVLAKIQQLKNIHNELAELWNKDRDYNIDLNEFLTDEYPFHESFDEIPIDQWYNEFKDKIDNLDDINNQKWNRYF